MSRTSVGAYWQHWESQGQEGDFFSFLTLNDGDDGKDKDNDKSEESDKGKESDRSEEGDRSEESDKDKSDRADGDAEDHPPDHFAIDDGIPYPFLCDASGRTACLQELVSTKGQVNKTFHEVIKLVDSMEVSPIPSI